MTVDPTDFYALQTHLRVVQNALITLGDVHVSEENRLQNASSFKDTAEDNGSSSAGRSQASSSFRTCWTSVMWADCPPRDVVSSSR